MIRMRLILEFQPYMHQILNCQYSENGCGYKHLPIIKTGRAVRSERASSLLQLGFHRQEYSQGGDFSLSLFLLLLQGVGPFICRSLECLMPPISIPQKVFCFFNLGASRYSKNYTFAETEENNRFGGKRPNACYELMMDNSCCKLS